jgi:hypothetical protein
LLHFTHREGELFGLERRLSDTQTLKVSRDGDALKADVLQNPVETRTRTIRGVIDSSLFEAVEAAGAHDQIAVSLADIFGWDIDFVLDVRPGDTFVVTYQEIWRDGAYLKDGPIQAAEFASSEPSASPITKVTRATTTPRAAASTRLSCAPRWSSRA